MAEHTKTPWATDGTYVVAKLGPTIADCGKSPSMDRREQRANVDFIIRAANNHDAMVKALETAAARFNLMAGVGLVNGADPKVGYRECMDALALVGSLPSPETK